LVVAVVVLQTARREPLLAAAVAVAAQARQPPLQAQAVQVLLDRVTKVAMQSLVVATLPVLLVEAVREVLLLTQRLVNLELVALPLLGWTA